MSRMVSGTEQKKFLYLSESRKYGLPSELVLDLFYLNHENQQKPKTTEKYIAMNELRMLDDDATQKVCFMRYWSRNLLKEASDMY